MGKGHRGTTKSGGQKDALDRFYTDEGEAKRLVDAIAGHLPELMIEPSAGRGAFVLALEEAGYDVVAYDIAPDDDPVCSTPIIRADFLSLGATDISRERPSYSPSSTAFVGNPPFGVQGFLAVEFVRHCLSLADDAWMILPPSFRKHSAADKVGDGELVDVIELGSTRYSTPTGEVDVPGAFMHWHACDGAAAKARRRREDAEAIAALPFEFRSWRELSDDPRLFIIRRTGGRSGTADFDTHVSSPTNYYLCRAKDGHGVAELIDWINGTDFPERDWSVGPRSLSKGEMALRLAQSPLR